MIMIMATVMMVYCLYCFGDHSNDDDDDCDYGGNGGQNDDGVGDGASVHVAVFSFLVMTFQLT